MSGIVDLSSTSQPSALSHSAEELAALPSLSLLSSFAALLGPAPPPAATLPPPDDQNVTVWWSSSAHPNEEVAPAHLLSAHSSLLTSASSLHSKATKLGLLIKYYFEDPVSSNYQSLLSLINSLAPTQYLSLSLFLLCL